MLKPDMKRFYREVTVAPAEDDPSADEPGRATFRILLDGRQVKTPIGKALAVPTQRLANAVAEEWDAQTEKIRPASMPLTQLAFTALDRVAPECAVIAQRIADYGGTDLVCYRAEAPQDLVQRQADAWDPLLDWVRGEWGAVLRTTAGIVPVDQDAAALAALSKVVGALDPHRLTALAAVVQSTGSLVIGLALLYGRLDGEAAIAVSQLDEDYQSEKWGADKEAVERLRGLSAEITQAEKFLGLL